MQGSKRWGYSGHHYWPDWKKVKKRLAKEFFFDRKRIKFNIDLAREEPYFILDNEEILRAKTLGYICWARHGYFPYQSVHDVLCIITDYFNVAKKDLIDHTLDEKTDPLAIHLILKCADKRIGVRRLRKMYCDLVFDGLLDGVNVKPAIKILQTRIKTKKISV